MTPHQRSKLDEVLAQRLVLDLLGGTYAETETQRLWLIDLCRNSPLWVPQEMAVASLATRLYRHPDGDLHELHVLCAQFNLAKLLHSRLKKTGKTK